MALVKLIIVLFIAEAFFTFLISLWIIPAYLKDGQKKKWHILLTATSYFFLLLIAIFSLLVSVSQAEHPECWQLCDLPCIANGQIFSPSMLARFAVWWPWVQSALCIAALTFGLVGQLFLTADARTRWREKDDRRKTRY